MIAASCSPVISSCGHQSWPGRRTAWSRLTPPPQASHLRPCQAQRYPRQMVDVRPERNPPGRVGGAAGQLGEVLVVSVDEPQLGVDLTQGRADGGEVASSVIVRPDAEIAQVDDERPLLAGQQLRHAVDHVQRPVPVAVPVSGNQDTTGRDIDRRLRAVRHVRLLYPMRVRAAGTGAQDSVTLAPSVPDDKALMSHSCSWEDMAGTFAP
jgi:hypothetical protein